MNQAEDIVTIKHQGINSGRMTREPLEAAYAKAWAGQAPGNSRRSALRPRQNSARLHPTGRRSSRHRHTVAR